MTFLYVSLAEHENYRAPQASIPIEETYLRPVPTKREWKPPTDAPRKPEKRSALLEDLIVLVVTDAGKPLDTDQIAIALGRSRGAVQKSIRWCVVDKRVKRTGRGSRAHPFVYRAAR